MGDDSFTYTVEDPDGNAATHTITVTVGPTDPVALDTDVQTDTDTAVIVSLEDLAFQPAGGSVTFTVSSAAHGTVVDHLDGTVTYTPDAGYTGTDTFSYTVTDASLRTASGTITVTVGPPPASPVAGILSALEGIEDLINGYVDESDVAAIEEGVSDAIGDIDDYADDTTAYISANNINTIAGQGYKDFAKDGYNLIRELYPRYLGFLDALAAVYAVGIETRDLIESLKAANAAEANQPQPNKVAIALRKAAIDNLMQVQVALIESYDKIYKRAKQAHLAAQIPFLDMQDRLTVILPNAIVSSFGPPPMPANATADLFPR